MKNTLTVINKEGSNGLTHADLITSDGKIVASFVVHPDGVIHMVASIRHIGGKNVRRLSAWLEYPWYEHATAERKEAL